MKQIKEFDEFGMSVVGDLTPEQWVYVVGSVRLGLNEEVCAKNLGINLPTVSYWYNAYEQVVRGR